MSGDSSPRTRQMEGRTGEREHYRRVPDFGGQVMAVNRVEELLKKVSTALEKAGIEYAVIGGNAIAAWVSTVDPDATRATRDVDILVRRAVIRWLRSYQPIFVRGSMKFAGPWSIRTGDWR